MAAKPTPALPQLRAEIERVKQALVELDELSYPRDEWRARLHEWVDRQAAESERPAAHGLSAMRAPYGRPQYIDSFSLSVLPSPGGKNFAHVNLSGLLCWLLRDTLLERIDAIVQATDYPEGPPSTERPARRAELETQLEQLEAREELAIRTLEADDRSVMRRQEARPELVLAWQEDLEARAGGKQP